MAETTNNQTLDERLKAGAMGAWCSFSSFSSVDLMASLGFDFLILEMQHSEIVQGDIPALLGAFGGSNCIPIVRAPQNDYHMINWLFDQGAPGVLVPMVNSVQDARAAVSAAKYPPLGKRSFGPFRAARYGTRLSSYIRQANEVSKLIVQIEDADAARNIDEILDVKGVDAVFMGPNDLAFSMLRPGDTLRANAEQWSAFARTPEVVDLCSYVLARCKAAGVPFGMTSGSMAEAREWLQRGAGLVTIGSDFVFLRSGVQQLCGL